VYHISHENKCDRAQSFAIFYSISNSRVTKFVETKLVVFQLTQEIMKM
jgi:hypothetical protein